jgi:hypothetical protein
MYALLLAASQPVVPAPLPPHGNWTVAYEQSMCLASRKFGVSGDVELLLRPSPVGSALEITVVDTTSKERRVVMDADGFVQAGPAGERQQVSYKAWRSPSQNGRVVIINAKQALLDQVSEDGWLSVEAGNKLMALQMKQFAKLRPVLADCKRKVAQHWGVDVAALERLAAPADPIGDPARWVSYFDFPSGASSGQVTMLFQVGLDGRASECRVIETTGEKSLEVASCRAMVQRARFRPALDRDGKPMVSWEIRRIRWLTAG